MNSYEVQTRLDFTIKGHVNAFVPVEKVKRLLTR